MKLFFQKIGEGKPLIILHGLYGYSDNWITIARKLSGKFQVYLVDQRNHGRSPHSAEHDYSVMANDLFELMMSENLRQAWILGHSMGGKTAMLFAAMYPDMVTGLIVVDIGPGGYANIDSPSSQVLTHLNIVSALQGIDLKKYSSRVDIERELARTIPSISIRQFLMKNVHRNTDNSFSWKLNVDAISKNLPLIMGKIHLDKLKNNLYPSFPILFIKGEFSDYINPEQQKLIKQYFSHAQLEEISGAGHWVHAEQPESFYNVISKFLATMN